MMEHRLDPEPETEGGRPMKPLRLFPRSWLGISRSIWVVMPVLLITLGYASFPRCRSSPQTEPSERADVMHEPIFLTREGDSFRAVPFGEHHGVFPLWNVNLLIDHHFDFSWRLCARVPCLLESASKWSYRLDLLPANDAAGQPLDELSARRGDRLERLLLSGARKSTYLNLQNTMLVLGVLTLPVSAMSFWSLLLSTSIGRRLHHRAPAAAMRQVYSPQ